MDNDDRMIGRILNRREVLALIGSAGATLLIGCSTGNNRSEPTPTTSAAQAPTSTTTPAAISTPTDPPSPTTSSESEATAMIDPTIIPNCVVAPELTEGPYYVDVDLERSDIRSDPSTGMIPEGTPLDLAVRAYHVSSEGCVPLANVAVDIWHCDAAGVYSGVRDPGFDTSDQQFLRGYQMTDENGICAFTTIYPGWYQGRAVHIHFKVQGDAGDGQHFEFTSQFFFDESITDIVHADEPYASKGYRTLLNEGDGIYQDGGDELILNVSPADDGSGYLATFDIGIQLA